MFNLKTNVLSQWSQQVGVLLKLFLLIVIHCVEWCILCNLCSLASWLLFQKEKLVCVCDWCVWGGKGASRTCQLFLVLRSRKLGIEGKQWLGSTEGGVISRSDTCMWWSLWPVCVTIFFNKENTANSFLSWSEESHCSHRNVRMELGWLLAPFTSCLL